MKEEDFLNIIKSVIGNKYVGDDCAYLKDLGIVISQDNLVEDVHFSLKYISPYQLGYKSVMVNISDIAASGAIPKYMTVALSLPQNTNEEFIEEFYKGASSALYGCEIIGGDITGSDKIVISIAVIGKTENRKISSRKNAKEGHVIVTSGVHGSSAAGLKLLQDNINGYDDIKKSHLMPVAQTEFSNLISNNMTDNYAMMDSSDGLIDAVYKIAQASNKTIELDFDKVTYDKTIQKLFPNDYKDLILYGGEDYQLIATVPEEFAHKHKLTVIGRVYAKSNNNFVRIKYNEKLDIINDINKCFNHFSKN